MSPFVFGPPGPRFVAVGEYPVWDEALAAVNRDLAVTLPEQPALRLVAYPDEDGGEWVHVALANGDAHGNALEPVSSAAEALRAVAGAAQDTVMELLWRAWPVCTLHGLGMHAAWDAGRAYWRCAGGTGPGDPAHLRGAVGELDTIHRPPRPGRRRRGGR
ncbi:hypothetical protein GCM10010503_21140 [Streptomyces lucensis JCM 4490]|uniref:Uncharacterized protein n=1 Tax=Streptomyces lucensis JCM 4490 TaxID=1306176 RepID=A0A918MQH2_9ACTN|nr:hypothetical protein [Streptomyces lucensis]GGW44160.1 hypothetical protein GCM10010503_21140 [Streptomyces lucensis JCM 4490]